MYDMIMKEGSNNVAYVCFVHMYMYIHITFGSKPVFTSRT